MIFSVFEKSVEKQLSVKKPLLTYKQALEEINKRGAEVKRLSWVGSRACLLRCGGRLYRISGEHVGCLPVTQEDMSASDYIVLKYNK